MRSTSPSRRSPQRSTCRSAQPSATRTALARASAHGSRRSSMRSRHDARARRDRDDSPAPAADAAARRGARASARRTRRRAQARARGGLRRPLPRQPDHARRAHGRGARPGGRGGRALRGGEPGQARAVRRDRRRPLQADRPPRRRPHAGVLARAGARADRPRQGPSDRRRRARRSRNADVRGWRGRGVIGQANGVAVSVTGLGCYVPDKVLTNDDIAKLVDTSDEWITERTGIKERRIAEPEQAMSDLALPASRQALARGGVSPDEIDLVIVAAVTPDMMFPTTSAPLADALGAHDAAAYDLLAGCTGFMYAVAQAYGMLAGGLSRKALVVGGDVLSKILDWTDRSTLVLFGDGAGAVVLERVERGGFLGFELGADGGGGENPWLPGSGPRRIEEPDSFVKMNGREVFKFATRVMVSSADAVLATCGRTIDDVDVYVPHQANKRIIDHAARKLGISEEKVVVNVDRYGNTSSGSIPLALADAAADGRLRDGELVLMTGMGAGLTWGSALAEWTDNGNGATR